MKALIKIGGSLLSNPVTLKKLLKTFKHIIKVHSIVILPGGGAFADLVRQYHLKYGFSDSTAHKLAIVTEDLVGILIAEYIEEGILTNNLDNTQQLLIQSKIPILLPSNIVLELNEIPHSWDVTSDSIAVYLADKLKITSVILVKDVDGLYTADPKKNPDAQLIPLIKAVDLKKYDESCVDRALPNFIKKYKVVVYLLNGNFPDRISQILNGKNAICSKITP
ncbi:MAG: hypothetical protein HWN67_11755 [Candidatus Helarchaeota archaeon]|nr:hypothetical protein [Candidatus Helarchaeota archaeon]